MIQQVTQSEASEIIRTYEPHGQFYLLDGDTYVGIDNSTEHAWTEEFDTFEECKAWLEVMTIPRSKRYKARSTEPIGSWACKASAKTKPIWPLGWRKATSPPKTTKPFIS